MIEKMVKSGALTGEKVDAWRKKLDDQEAVEKMRQKAETGDVTAMETLGSWYIAGKMGLTKDCAQGFRLCKQAADKGGVTALCQVGRGYLEGVGIEMCTFQALTVLTQAAERGSEHACYLLGFSFGTGHNGVPKDESFAREWYTKMRTSTGRKDSQDILRDKADTWLLKHPLVLN